ncbi:MAG: serine/threonine protein kinase [Myxococcota bacterium]
MSQTNVQIGDVIDDKYEVVGELGAGGMGVVLEGLHRGLDRKVAIKLLRDNSKNNDPDFRARFSREAKVQSRLDHPNAVRVYDYGSHEGALFLVMEFLQGHPLEDEVGDGPMEQRRALVLAEQICDVLTVTHDMNLVHRDIKPENIFITETDQGPHATLVDFGLAFIATDEDLARLTQEGIVAGTPQFLSPEQARGRADIGPASDIYSLGCVLYELLTGEPVVEGESIIHLLNQHVMVPATSMRMKVPEAEISASLDNFVLSMLAKEPAERPTAIEAGTFLRKTLASDDMRGRGRPARLLQPRTRRALTASGMDGADVPERTAEDIPADKRRSLGVIGEISKDLVVAAHVSGWQPKPFSPGGSFDVVVAMRPDDVTEELVSNYPTMAVVGSYSVSEAVDLLEMGVEDILAFDESEDIIRKAQRLFVSQQRRGRS